VFSVYMGVAESARELAVREVSRKRQDPSVQALVGEMDNELTTARMALRHMLDAAATGSMGPETTNAVLVGRTLAGAEQNGLKVRAVDVETAANAGASFHGRNAPGTSRIVVDEDRGVIVGATFVGPEVAESLHAATIAVTGEVSLERLWHAVPSFPTRSEVWLKLLEAYGL